MAQKTRATIKSDITDNLQLNTRNRINEIADIMTDITDSYSPQGNAYIRAREHGNHAVEVQYELADESWQLVLVDSTAPTAPEIELQDTSNNTVDIALPDVFLRRGSTPKFTLHRGSTVTQAAVAAYANLLLTGTSNAGVTITHNTPGESGNDFVVEVHYKSFGYITASYQSATHLNIYISFNHPIINIVTVVNNARWQGNQIVTASIWNGATGNVVGVPDGVHHLQHGQDAITTSREPLSFEYIKTSSVDEFRLTLIASDTIGEIVDIIEDYSFHGERIFQDKITLQNSASRNRTLNASNIPSSGSDIQLTFTGGSNGTSIDAIVDNSLKEVRVNYAENWHHLRDLINDYSSGVSIIRVAGSNLDQLIEEPTSKPFDFNEIVLESSDAETVKSIEVLYWQDENENSSPPNNANTKRVRIGQGLYTLEFETLRGNRYLHIELSNAYRLQTVAIEQRNKLGVFSTEEVGDKIRYHSRKITSAARLELLIELNEK